jgi:hypothetical protein
MTRLRPASAIATLFLLGSTATASTDRGWILWSQGAAESITAMKDDDNFTGLACLPDTVDPRG